ncbi:MAG: hypothetical protein ABJA98_33450 [Acidobacteriota bacterium]
MNMTPTAVLVAGLALAGSTACSNGTPDSKPQVTETKTVVTETTETRGGDTKSSEKTIETKTTETRAADSTSAARREQTVAKTIKWENEKWIPLNLASEGVEIKEIKFQVEGGVNFNPLRAGKGPQAFMPVKNTSDHKMKLAVAIALFDDRGSLVAATEITYGGSLDPGQTGELKMTFRDVKRRFFDASTAQVALETRN